MSKITCLGWMLGAAIAAIGCAGTGTMPTEEAQRQLEEREAQLSKLEGNLETQGRELDQSRSQVQQLEQELASRTPHVSAAPPSGAVTAGIDLLPPAAKPGQCFARLFVPPTYQSEPVSMLKHAASARIETVPARYERTEEQVLVKEASERIEVVPAELGWVEERVLVKQASTRIEEVPATYRWESEEVLVKPAQTVWKKGRGPIERIDQGTGEIMCLVEIPAEYKTVKQKVLDSAAATRTVEIPAEYKTVRRQVVTKPSTTRTVAVPAEYTTVKVRKLVEPARENRIDIPAEYQTVTKRALVADGRMEWRPVLCETNATRQTVTSIQQALKTAGHDPGPIDGIIGHETLGAVRSFQEEKSLPAGGLTYATIDALGVKVGR